MKNEKDHFSEIVRILDGPLRLDLPKVRNYTENLAEKLDAGGDKDAARRLRRLLNETENQLQPLELERS